MKKLALFLTLALVLAFAAPVFANPFSDVPADHWAYEAINKLADDGVITGNPDGTYTGNKTMTRYELAVVVAKAMAAAEANADKVSAEDKATIDKLAAEFGGELNALGVKVAALEKKVGNVKFTGDARVRYRSDKERTKGTDANGVSQDVYKNKQNSSKIEYRVRLTGTATVNDNISVTARFTSGDYDIADNRAGKESNGDQNAYFDKFFVQYSKNGVTAKAGREEYVLGTSVTKSSLLLDDFVKGFSVQAPLSANVKATIIYGRLDETTANGADLKTYGVADGDRVDFSAIQLSAKMNDAMNVGAAYTSLKNKDRNNFPDVNGAINGANKTTGVDNAKTGSIFFDYAANKKVTFFGEVAKTNVKSVAQGEAEAKNRLQNAYQLGLVAKDVVKGTDLTLNYVVMERNFAYANAMLGSFDSTFKASQIYKTDSATVVPADKTTIWGLRLDRKIMANTTLFVGYNHVEAKGYVTNAGGLPTTKDDQTNTNYNSEKKTLDRFETGLEFKF